MGRLGDKKANWILGGVCVSVLGAERHRQEAGECVRWAVDVIGRCNGPCLCPPSWTGAKNVCSHVRLLLFYQSFLHLSSKCKVVCTIHSPLSSWGA